MTTQPPARTFGDSPVHRMLGLELLARSKEAAELRLPLKRDFMQEEGVVQGGILATLADAACVYLLLPDLGQEESLTSIEFKVNFLAPATLERGALHARAEPIRRGRRISVCRATVNQSNGAVLEGLFTYLVSPAR